MFIEFHIVNGLHRAKFIENQFVLDIFKYMLAFNKDGSLRSLEALEDTAFELGKMAQVCHGRSCIGEVWGGETAEVAKDANCSGHYGCLPPSLVKPLRVFLGDMEEDVDDCLNGCFKDTTYSWTFFNYFYFEGLSETREYERDSWLDMQREEELHGVD